MNYKILFTILCYTAWIVFAALTTAYLPHWLNITLIVSILACYYALKLWSRRAGARNPFQRGNDQWRRERLELRRKIIEGLQKRERTRSSAGWLVLVLVMGLAFSAQSQTNDTLPPAPPLSFSVTNPPTVSGGLAEIWDAINSTNWLLEVHGLYAPGLGKRYGAGIGLFYPINDYLYAGVRGDYVDGGFWMPSGNVGLQFPIKPLTFLGGFFTNVTMTPFGYAGVAVPISGAVIGNTTIPGSVPRDNNGQPTAILGYGASLLIYQPSSHHWNIDLLVDRETWTGFSGQQYRFALAYHKRF